MCQSYNWKPPSFWSACSAPVFGPLSSHLPKLGLALVDKIGAGPLNGLIITANLLTSLAIEHFGLMNMPVHSVNGWRVIGGVLMAAGIVLITRF